MESRWGPLAQYDWSVMAPEFTILILATLLSLIDLFAPKKMDRRYLAWLGIAGSVLAGWFVFQNVGIGVVEILDGSYRVDAYGNIFKLIFLGGTILTLLMSTSYLDNKKEVQYHGEFYYLILTGLLGAMIMSSSADLITLFVGLELLSISSYILVGTRKNNLQTNESAFKYVVSGSIASATTLYGFSFLYGLTGTTNIFLMGEYLGEAYAAGNQFIIYLAFALTLVGLSFKISSVPYHMWAPDVYQGAPTPVTAFLSVVSKAAGFALIIRVVITVFRNVVDYENALGPKSVLIDEITFVVGVLAAISMIVGNTLALRQTNIKRMMAYSSIAQAGYILVPFATITSLIFEQTVFYLVAYLLMNMGAFAIIMIVTRDRETEDLVSFAGLYHRSPWLAIAMTMFLLSLAGIPISAGFFGKFYIFMSSLVVGNYWLAGIMVATSVVSYYYYFGIIRQMYMRPGATEEPIRIPAAIAVIVLIAFIGTVGVGLVPDTLMNFIHNNFPFIEMIQAAG
ncbi:NADH-quinone oxidoreductase subunit NuoN [Ammoniphilus sp. CFH 90114]|uniref:NADH-quinone oxidoreductase subunit NuoN n=1 Tax=Ammoniphilus sp. CFH 90114 TaxID=2493665 RepID=UPI00100EBE21|nr:NADH-quinone oxidoreductase subunit NuoN [Ammoniphilus sp. CFH 90114]RXT01532.1 NADH-quinone oxidoreductase subunit NuoN [Ammoniphilus sp. CFH 90114]